MPTGLPTRAALFLAYALAHVCLTGSSATPSSAVAQAPVELSPHAAALDLVFQTQVQVIRRLDTEHWWHDTKERTWRVRRPFAPGPIDSTHTFEVTYRIDGRDVGAWSVDTRRGRVTATPRRDP